MNKVILLVNVFTLLYNLSIAQKPLIDIHGESWETFDLKLISNNGKYIAYTTHASSGEDLFIRSTQSEWQMSVHRAELLAFTQDSRKVIFKLGDSVGIIDLIDTNGLVFLKDIRSCRVVKWLRDNDLLIYTVKQRPDQLVIREVENGKEESYSAIENYWSSDDGNIIALEMIKKDSSIAKYALKWLDIGKSELRTIWEGKKIQDLKIGHNNLQCVLSASASDDAGGNDIWIYRDTDEKAVKVLDGQCESLKGMVINGIIAFNDLSGRVFLYLSLPNIKKESLSGLTSVDIWSYKDAMLQSEQLGLLKGNTNYKAVLNVTNRQLIRLEYQHESIRGSQLFSDKAMNYVLLLKDGGGPVHEWNWNSKSRKAVYLVDLNNGHRRLIADGLPDPDFYSYVLSFNEHYIFYYDLKMKGYYSYRVSDGIRTNMTAGMHGRWEQEGKSDKPDSSYYPYLVIEFIKNTDAILVYDQNDIFKLDPTSNIPTRNLTETKCHSHTLVFRLLTDIENAVIDSNERVCLSVFNRVTKDACLTSICIGQTTPIGSLNFVPYSFSSGPPLKARDKDVFVVERMSAEESPNLFFTIGFCKYNTITDTHPERAYNWMKAELVTWRTFDGDLSQGILYKPDNFDAQKKYPVLVYYYEKLSDGLHNFIYPASSNGNLNIPYYVSHGYLVFMPDIHYKIGWPGRSAYNCVVSGVQYLSKRAYVDIKRMGLQGHSFGAFETNYIVTHCKLFAAAMSASGVSDFVSGYATTAERGHGRQFLYELDQSRIGATLWKKPGSYLENSPILWADRISTPLLIMANKEDAIVPYQQGVELFISLRRLGKKAWMLQYDRENHNVQSREAQEDLTIRMAQFFNYYLKGEPPPRWMTVGVPASLKGIDSGLEIDTSGVKP